MEKQWVSKFLKEEDGQTTTEYVLILAVVVTIFMNFRRGILKVITKLMNGLNEQTDKVICNDDVCS